MGLPGSGKSTLAEKLTTELCKNNPTEWINADDVRTECNDWDFSSEGRIRQARRMRLLADKGQEHGIITISDFVCPTRELREIFDADMTIWMDTIESSRYKDTNKVFEPPTEDEYDIRIDKFDSDQWSSTLADLIYILVPNET